MYGADFEVEWEPFGDRYWVLRERASLVYRAANERRFSRPNADQREAMYATTSGSRAEFEFDAEERV